MPRIVLTPDKFFDIFVLCLYWQWDDVSLNYCWTTVDKVVRILHGLDIVSSKQRKALSKDLRTQSVFAMRSVVFVSSLDCEKPGVRRDELLNDSKRLIVYAGSGVFNRERMLRDKRILLTRRGVEYAKSIEARYADVVTMVSYAEEIIRQELDKDAAMGAIMSRYREKVRRESSKEDERAAKH